MGVSVFVMPLSTWLSGEFRTTWGAESETASPPRGRRTPEAAERLCDEFMSRLEPLLGHRPEWDERGPARSATAFSIHSFSLPFLQARRWAYRLKLTQLGVLESAQIWIPSEFEPVFRLDSLWSDDAEVLVASLPRLHLELGRLLEALREDEAGDWPELREVGQVAEALRERVVEGIRHRMPVIVEG